MASQAGQGAGRAAGMHIDEFMLALQRTPEGRAPKDEDTSFFYIRDLPPTEFFNVCVVFVEGTISYERVDRNELRAHLADLGNRLTDMRYISATPYTGGAG